MNELITQSIPEAMQIDWLRSHAISFSFRAPRFSEEIWADLKINKSDSGTFYNGLIWTNC